MTPPSREDHDAVARWLDVPAKLGALVLFTMMILTVVDVVGRYFLNSPVPGSAEATELLLAVAVFAGIPIAALRGEHIRIDILEHFFGERVRAVQALIGGMLAALVMALVAWRLWLRAQELAGYDERSSHLGFPMAWLAGFLAFSALLAVVGFAVHAWRSRRGGQ